MHRNEREILRILFKESRPLTVYELSDQSGMSWVTVKKYLHLLLRQRLAVLAKDNKRYLIADELIDALVEYNETEQ